MIPVSPLWAVHISDGVLEWPWLVGGGVLLAFGVFFSLFRIRDDEIPRLGVLTALLFVASQVHIPTGIMSVHFLGNGLAGVILRFRAIAAIAVSLRLQALLLGHGGVLAIGVNGCILAIPAVLAGYTFRALVNLGDSKLYLTALGLMLGFVTATITVLLQAAVLLLGGEGDFRGVAIASLTIHIPIILLEGVIVAGVVRVLANARPEWIGIYSSGKTSSNGTSH